MFPKAAPLTGNWYDRVAGELEVASNKSESFITWHIRQWMDDPAETKAMFYKHVTDRWEASQHV